LHIVKLFEVKIGGAPLLKCPNIHKNKTISLLASQGLLMLQAQNSPHEALLI
jgi:hypothetical protein